MTVNVGSRMTAAEVAAYVQQRAPTMGLDAAAVMAVSEQEGLGGGIGDGGHAFGPWQLNDAGGAMPANVKAQGAAYEHAWAWSTEGIDYALGQMQGVAGGMQGAAAVTSIATNFERPRADLLAGEISRGIAGLTSWYAHFGQGAQIPGVTTPGQVQPKPGITDVAPKQQAAPTVQAGSFVGAMQTLVGGWLGPGLQTLKIKPDMSGLILLLASVFAVLIGAIIWRGDDVKSAAKEAPKVAAMAVMA